MKKVKLYRSSERDRKGRFVKGHPFGKRFKKGHKLTIGKNHPSYNYGLTKKVNENKWYIVCRDNSQIPFARAVMEAYLKRELISEEIVHHGKDSLDDGLDNLILFRNQSEHQKYHRRTNSKERERKRNYKISVALSGRKIPEEVKKKISETTSRSINEWWKKRKEQNNEVIREEITIYG